MTNGEQNRVLILEDVVTDAELVTREVRRVLPGAVYRVVDTGAAFQQSLMQLKPNLVLSDYRLPAFDGISALEMVRKYDEDTPFIFVTGSMDEDTAVECMKAGAWDYVVKEQLRRLGPAILASLERQRQRALRRQSDEALIESEAQFRALAEHSGDQIVRYDRQHTQIYANPSAIRASGASDGEFIGRPIDEMGYPEEHCKRWKAAIDHVFATGETYGEVIEVEDYQGTRSLDWRLFPERDPKGELRAVLGVARDITELTVAQNEQQQLQAQLLQAQKMEAVGRLAGGVAHDFNNMLGVITGTAELAMQSVEPDSPLQEDLAEILRSAQRSSDLTRQLLAFARQQAISPRILDLNETIESMLKMLRRLIGEDITLTWLPKQGLWPVKMDPSQVDQILANLCVNARDAINGVGSVTIETSHAVLDKAYCADHPETEPGEYAVLVLTDDGCGMAPEVMQHLFEPFFTTKPVGEGTGLGLATVYGIVRQNSGAISAYSEPGLGTTFRIYLPRAAHAARPEITESSAPKRGNGETVLLVEDEAAILRMSQRVLASLGYTVLAANTPQEAILLAVKAAGGIDLLITDVVMPMMSGKALAQEIQTLQPSLRCLYMSGYTADVIANRGVLDVGVQFIQKPFGIRDLSEKVWNILHAS